MRAAGGVYGNFGAAEGADLGGGGGGSLLVMLELVAQLGGLVGGLYDHEQHKRDYQEVYHRVYKRAVGYVHAADLDGKVLEIVFEKQSHKGGR